MALAILLTRFCQILFQLLYSRAEADGAHDKFELISIIYEARFAIEIKTIAKAVDILFAKKASLLRQVRVTSSQIGRARRCAVLSIVEVLMRQATAGGKCGGKIVNKRGYCFSS